MMKLRIAADRKRLAANHSGGMNWLPNFITGQLPPQIQIATTTHTRNSRLIGCGREVGMLADRAGAAMAVDIRGSRGETARRSRHAAAHPNGSHGREEAADSAAVFDGGNSLHSTSCREIADLKIIYPR
jgi:hypothetical protein